MRGGHDEPQGQGMPGRATGADEIRRHNRFAVAWLQGVQSPKTSSDRERQENHPET
jgi:hypothetical protein